VLLLFTLVSVLSSCKYPNGKYPIYTPSERSKFDRESTERTINRSFDEVWTALIEYASTSFFVIKDHDKESGLITLHFGPGKIAEFIDCGYLESIVVNFKGPFIEGIETYGEADLDGNMKILVTPLSVNGTQVEVNTHYVFEGRDPKTRQVWAFDAGGSDGKRYSSIQEDVICFPTHKAEQAILESIDNIAQ